MLGSLAAVILALDANTLARETLRDQQEVGAWQLLTAPARGSAGKQLALRRLLQPGVTLNNIDLGCEGIGGSFVGRECQGATDLSNFENEPSQLDWFFGGAPATLFNFSASGAIIRNATFSYLSFAQANFDKAALNGTTFRDSQFRDTTFRDADLRGVTFENPLFRKVDLTGAILAMTAFTDGTFEDVNISGTILCAFQRCSTALNNPSFLLNAWFYKNAYPKNLELLPSSSFIRAPCPVEGPCEPTIVPVSSLLKPPT